MSVDPPARRRVGSRTHAARGRGPTTRTITKLPMSEDDWQRLVVDLAHASGWIVAHFGALTIETRRGPRTFTPAREDGAGWPDLALAHPGRHLRVLAELKQDGKHPTPAQRVWLDALGPSDGRTAVEVWRPADERRVRAILSGQWWPV